MLATLTTRFGGRSLGVLGAYPTDPYFDPNRPAWVPYWIDTPTESALKYGLYPGVTTLAPLPPPPAPPGPGGYAVPLPGETQAEAQARADLVAWQEWQQQVNRHMADLAAEEEARQRARDAGLSFPQWLLLGVLGVGSVLVLGVLRR